MRCSVIKADKKQQVNANHVDCTEMTDGDFISFFIIKTTLIYNVLSEILMVCSHWI